MQKLTTWVKESLRLRELSNLLLILIAGFPVYKSGVTTTLLILFSILSIYNWFVSDRHGINPFNVIRLKYFFITLGFYFAMVFSLTYSSNTNAGLSLIIRTLPILIFPLTLFFFTDKISNQLFNRILYAFLSGCLIYLFYLHCEFYSAGLYTEFRPAQFYDLPFRDVILNLEYAPTHPTYASIWFLFAALFLITKLLKRLEFSVTNVIYLLIITFLVISSVLLSSKIAILGFFASLVVLILFYIKGRTIKLLTFSAVTVLFLIAIFNVSFLKSRFIDEYNATELKPPVGLATNSLNIRVGIYQCVLQIYQDNWLFGVGLGDVQDELNKCYEQFDTNVYKEITFNTHNEYLNIGISCGVLGLILFLFMLIFHIVDSLKNGNLIFLAFLVALIIWLFPENLLVRHHGIIFYSLFSSLFIKQNLQNTEKYESIRK